MYKLIAKLQIKLINYEFALCQFKAFFKKIT